jgi:hypothetical protein
MEILLADGGPIFARLMDARIREVGRERSGQDALHQSLNDADRPDDGSGFSAKF